MNIAMKKWIFFGLSVSLPSVLVVAFINLTKETVRSCDSSKVAELLSRATEEYPSVSLDCSVSLRAGDVVDKKIIIQGPQSSGIEIDCGGGRIVRSEFSPQEAFSINSEEVIDPVSKIRSWNRVENVRIKNCKVEGAIRIRGMATNGEGEFLRESSVKDEGHTKRAQLSAPRNIVLDSLEIITDGPIPIYVGPGSTNVRIINSKFSGVSQSVTIYLDAESADNAISRNTFEVMSQSREVIAVDGSARNIIQHNLFKSVPNGGVFIYRNCGEGGTVRHQKPEGNNILNNTFFHQTALSINVGSRRGQSSYCAYDLSPNGKPYPFGSSLSNLDFAENTIISGNKFLVNSAFQPFTGRYLIASSEKSTKISNNQAVISSRRNLAFTERVFGSFSDAGGNVVRTPTSGLPPGVKTVNLPFDCQVTGKNSGCYKTIQCPEGRKIFSAKAACNLEYGTVPSSVLKNLSENELLVVAESDSRSSGLCKVGTDAISTGSRKLSSHGSISIEIGCRESDKNGGDCHIRGELRCL